MTVSVPHQQHCHPVEDSAELEKSVEILRSCALDYLSLINLHEHVDAKSKGNNEADSKGVTEVTTRDGKTEARIEGQTIEEEFKVDKSAWIKRQEIQGRSIEEMLLGTGERVADAFSVLDSILDKYVLPQKKDGGNQTSDEKLSASKEELISEKDQKDEDEQPEETPNQSEKKQVSAANLLRLGQACRWKEPAMQSTKSLSESFKQRLEEDFLLSIE